MLINNDAKTAGQFGHCCIEIPGTWSEDTFIKPDLWQTRKVHDQMLLYALSLPLIHIFNKIWQQGSLKNVIIIVQQSSLATVAAQATQPPINLG